MKTEEKWLQEKNKKEKQKKGCTWWSWALSRTTWQKKKKTGCTFVLFAVDVGGNIRPPLKVEECFREGVSQPAVDDYSSTEKCG